ncbi:MAG: DUF4428 domain-containing protein [Bacillota bacterium]|nr:DUF4428 domain-containing protein [Bacillota bacterium]
MGLFGKLFEKKECAICGGEIGLLGNRKLEDGNMCKECAKKLSPWFTDRKESTVAEIEEQLAYREANRERVEAFQVTRILGEDKKIYLDEDKMQFFVSGERNWKEENPDILDFTQVTGVDLDTSERHTEEKRQTPDGEWVSYNPPRYTYYYDFDIAIMVNHPYFECMKFQLNRSSVTIEESGRRGFFGGGHTDHPRIREYEELGYEIKRVLTEARQTGREAAAAAAAPKQAMTCPWCGATTTANANGCCEYCGGSLQN